MSSVEMGKRDGKLGINILRQQQGRGGSVHGGCQIGCAFRRYDLSYLVGM